MLNLNNISILESDSPMEDSQGSKDFPTAGLKSILNSGDLLDLLMKPIQNTDDNKKKDGYEQFPIPNANETYNSELNNLNFDDLLKPNKEFIDHDYFEYKADKLNMSDDSSKTYGNAFLGPSLWDKGDIFQGEKFGVECLGIDDFLNDNNLNEDDIKFLDNLQTNTNEAAQVQESMDQSINSKSFDRSPTAKTVSKNQEIPDSIPTIKVKDDSKITPLASPIKQSITSIMNQWKNDLDDENMNSDFDEMPIPSKKFFEERLVLQATMKKSKKQFVPNELKDEKYWARRKKNNVAAKRSRDTRRFKENQIVITATYLEHENTQLRQQLEECKAKMAQMEAKIKQYEQSRIN